MKKTINATEDIKSRVYIAKRKLFDHILGSNGPALTHEQEEILNEVLIALYKAHEYILLRESDPQRLMTEKEIKKFKISDISYA